MASIPASNVEGPETETVELKTSRVPENVVLPEEVSPPVATAEKVPCQPPPVATAEKVPCQPPPFTTAEKVPCQPPPVAAAAEEGTMSTNW